MNKFTKSISIPHHTKEPISLQEQIQQFMYLFRSNPRSYGQFYPESSKMLTVKKEFNSDQFLSHFQGKIGVGAVPILDDNHCFWGAIDIDNHSGTDVNLSQISKSIHDQGLPLLLCESKSGGAHCYLFTKEPISARYIRNILSRWSSDIGYPGSEIFPKQTILYTSKETGFLQLGNWINLPYFHTTQRTAMVYEPDKLSKKCFKRLSLSSFLALATSLQVSRLSIEEFLVLDHQEAPPCIQSIIKDGVDTGYRNETIYNLTIYFHKMDPNNFREKIYNLNQTLFPKPLSFAEVKKTVTSASKSSYRYKCTEEPLRSLCDPETCLGREYGISEAEAQCLNTLDMPEITDLKIYDMEPVVWEMTINNTKINITTSQLYSYRDFSQIIMEKLLLILPPMKNVDWMNKLSGIMPNVQRIETPEDASIPGIVKQRLVEFLLKADLESDGMCIDDRRLIRRGIPIVQILGEKGVKGRFVIFRGLDFISYLKRMKSEELKGSFLWSALRAAGVEHTRLRIDNKIKQVWAVALDKNNSMRLDYNYKNNPEATSCVQKSGELTENNLLVDYTRKSGKLKLENIEHLKDNQKIINVANFKSEF